MVVRNNMGAAIGRKFMNLDTLVNIAETLNEHGICWGLGASSMLYFHGLVDNPRDIDIMVDEADALKASAILSAMATWVRTDDGRGKYATRYFFEMEIDKQAVDLIGGYRILRNDWIYDFPSLRDCGLESVELWTAQIPLTPIEDWYVAYLVMGDPKARAALIEDYAHRCPEKLDWVRLEKAKVQIMEKASFETELIRRLDRLEVGLRK